MVSRGQRAALRESLRLLKDAEGLADAGVSPEWIDRSATLVEEYRRLRRRFQELKSQLCDADSDPREDTMLM